jgi:hypothetical protein
VMRITAERANQIFSTKTRSHGELRDKVIWRSGDLEIG